MNVKKRNCLNEQVKKGSPSVGIALSGGGVEGFAHIGALQALNELGVHTDVIAGTSSGSVFASLYALGFTPNEMLDIGKQIYHSINSISVSRLARAIIGFLRHGHTGVDSLIDASAIEHIIDNCAALKGIHSLTDIKEPVLALVSVDTILVKELAFCSHTPPQAGPFDTFQQTSPGKAVRASMAFPGLFQPVEIGSYSCIDGGTIDNLPTRILKSFNVNTIIAIDFNTERYTPTGDLERTALRALDVYSRDDVRCAEQRADITITIDNGDTNIWEIASIEDTVRNGYDSVMAAREDIDCALMHREVLQ